MLKKLNGKIVKILAYLRKNYLSFTFKLSVFTTMLVLIYLVCALAHADSVRSADNGVAYPIESSEKLMLTIPPEVLLSSEKTIEDLTALDNFISKSADYAGGHPLFPIQKQATTPAVPRETTTEEGSPEAETTTTSSLKEETVTNMSAETETTTEPCFKEETATEAALEVEVTTATSFEAETTTLPTIEEEVATEPIPQIEVTTKTTLEMETTPKDIVSNPVSTIPFKRSLSPDELKMWETTTDIPIEDSTHGSQYTEDEQIETEQQSEQESKQESPEESKEETQEEPKELQEAEQEELLQELSHEALLTTTFIPYLGEIEPSSATSTTPSPDIPKSDNLFMDNWPNYLDISEDITQIHPPLESSTPMSHIELHTEDFFKHEDDEISTLVAPPIVTEEPKTTTDSHEIKAIIHQTIEHPLHSVELFKDSYEEKMIPPILSPNSLLNLFSFDHHVPAPSNKKPMWWAKPKNAPVPARAPRAKSHKRHANSIRPMEASEEEVNASPNFFKKLPQFQHLDTLLNDKLQSSVSFFERLFGNFR